MTDQPENPQAFPGGTEGFGAYEITTRGMTLRDLFAAAALTGMGTWSIGGTICSPTSLSDRAAWAYQQADAMLRERGK